MRLVFCGTPQFAVPTLKHLLAQPGFDLLDVITQPDRPSGRGQEISLSPVKNVALAAGIPVHQPEKIRAPESETLLRSLAPDCIVIIAYGQIIPARLLDIPRLGWINLHSSLLPKYRGAAPIHWAIANGETHSGLTTMRIDAGMDTGDMLLQQKIAIGPEETSPELAARMSEAGAPLMQKTLESLAQGTLTPRPQDHSQATLAPILKREDGRIDWSRPASVIFNRIRAFTPWPGAHTFFRGQDCQIWGRPVSNTLPELAQFQASRPAPGTLVRHTNVLYVACGDTTVFQVVAVKREGRKQTTAAEFANGARLTERERFGET